MVFWEGHWGEGRAVSLFFVGFGGDLGSWWLGWGARDFSSDDRSRGIDGKGYEPGCLLLFGVGVVGTVGSWGVLGWRYEVYDFITSKRV